MKPEFQQSIELGCPPEDVERVIKLREGKKKNNILNLEDKKKYFGFKGYDRKNKKSLHSQ